MPGRDPYSYIVRAEEPALGDAAYNNGGGQLANAISAPAAPKAIESGAGKVIAGMAEDML